MSDIYDGFEWDSEDLALLAKRQKQVLYVIFATIVYYLFITYMGNYLLRQNIIPLSSMKMLLLGGNYTLIFLKLYFLYRLMQALKKGADWIALIVFVPYIGFIALVYANYKATQLLKRNGVSVGLFGASSNSIKELSWKTY